MDQTPELHLLANTSPGAQSLVWRLHVLASGDARWSGHTVALAAGSTIAGRGSLEVPQRLQIDDPLASRRHLQFEVTPGRVTVVVKDLGSRNGIWCNGQKTLGAALGHGAVVRFAHTVLVLEADAGRAVGFAEPHPEVPGRSELARVLREDLQFAASTGLPTLLLGATGSGKEHAASALHERAGRRGRLVRVNAAGIPATLLDAELFGAAAGAYTGARERRVGLLEQARGGTLVLDEIGELPLDLQPKLLRAFNDSFRPLGGTTELPLDVKLVASTNADLPALVDKQLFRADLLARLRGTVVRLPGLAERRPDLLALADALLPRAAEGRARSWAQLLPAEVVELLLLHPWPYNLRDLRTVLQALVPLLSDPAKLYWRARTELDRLSGVVSSAAPASAQPAPGEWDLPPGARPTKAWILALFEACGGNVSEMARRTKRHPRQIYRWLKFAGVATLSQS